MATFSSPQQHAPSARELVANGSPLLDVRSPEEFQERHLSGAINIPLTSLTGRIAELGPPSRPIVVYCRSGARSAAAAVQLRDAGYKVVDIGGIGNW